MAIINRGRQQHSGPVLVKVIPKQSFAAYFDGVTKTHLGAGKEIEIPATFAKLYVADGRCTLPKGPQAPTKQELEAAAKAEEARLADEKRLADEEAERKRKEELGDEGGAGGDGAGDSETTEDAALALEAAKADLSKHTVAELLEMAKSMEVAVAPKLGKDEIVKLLATKFLEKPS